MGDHHVVALEKEMGVQIEETREVSLVVGNFLETIINFPVSTSGNYQSFKQFFINLYSQNQWEVSPDEIFEKFDRWASDLHSMHLILNASEEMVVLSPRKLMK